MSEKGAGNVRWEASKKEGESDEGASNRSRWTFRVHGVAGK